MITLNLKTPLPRLIFLFLIVTIASCAKDSDIFSEALDQEIAENIERSNTNDTPAIDDTVSSELKAFPSAEGFGKYATGGRGGEVYKVTNLNDSGEGSFRAACEASGARTIIFEVDGQISLNSTINITNNNLTIAGHTAPGDGVVVSLEGINAPAIEINADNVIIRFLRVRHSSSRPVEFGSADNIYIASGSNIILDHCSATWAGDESVAIAKYSSAPTENITVQNCIIGGGYNGSAKGALVTANTTRVTFYQNYFPHNLVRSPHIASDMGLGPTSDTFFEVINNVTYNYKFGFSAQNTDGQGTPRFNVVGNYYRSKPGFPAGRKAVYIESINPISVFVRDNIDIHRTSSNDEEWIITQGVDGIENKNILGDTNYQATAPYNTQMISEGISLLDAVDVFDNIQNHVGASLPRRDAVDQALINDYLNGTGDIGVASHVFPELLSGTPSRDTDDDGIPDYFEDANSGFDSNQVDSNLDVDGDGYTNLEEYLNYLASAVN